MPRGVSVDQALSGGALPPWAAAKLGGAFVRRRAAKPCRQTRRRIIRKRRRGMPVRDRLTIVGRLRRRLASILAAKHKLVWRFRTAFNRHMQLTKGSRSAHSA